MRRGRRRADPVVHGDAADGWGAVADVFRASLEDGGELGAACAVYHAGRPVVDLWGGVADGRTGRPWEEDTVALVFSTTKGVTSVCAHMLVERGALDVDAPVARYWPEFGRAGKSGLLVRWLLSHRAGLTFVDAPLTLDEACAWEPVVRALERQEPLWEPGTRHAYHQKTFGFLVGELVRRVSGKTVGAFFADEVAGPLGLSAWIGLPDAVEGRVAHLDLTAPPPDPRAALDAAVAQLPARPSDEALRALLDDWADPGSAGARAATLGGAFDRSVVNDERFNTREVRAAELPSSNLVTDARSLARLYAAVIGEVDGVRLLAPETVETMCVVQTSESTPYGLPPGLEALAPTFSLGFMRPSRFFSLLGPRSFGHGGAGGSLALGDPELDVGFGYVVNRMAPDARRATALLRAVGRCIGG